MKGIGRFLKSNTFLILDIVGLLLVNHPVNIKYQTKKCKLLEKCLLVDMIWKKKEYNMKII